MSAVLIAYLITVAIAFPTLLTVLWRAWADGADEDAKIAAVIASCLMCGAGPAALLGLIAVRLATREPQHIRRAREAAEAAEYLARESEAIAARERALGLR